MKPQWIAIPLLAILLILLIGAAAGPLWVANITMPLRLQAVRAAQAVSNFSSWMGDVRKLTQDRDNLATERNQLLAQVADLQSEKQENEALKKQIESNTSINKQLIMAHTAGLSQQGDSSYLLIDKGAREGLTAGQMVLSDGVLVGRIKQTADHSSLVQLPLSLDNTIPVVIRHGDSTTKGVVQGSFNLTAQLNQVLPTDQLQQGDIIETSADGSMYQPGLVVGKVGPVSKGNNQLFQTAPVVLLWDIRKLEYVFILK